MVQIIRQKYVYHYIMKISDLFAKQPKNPILHLFGPAGANLYPYRPWKIISSYWIKNDIKLLVLVLAINNGYHYIMQNIDLFARKQKNLIFHLFSLVVVNFHSYRPWEKISSYWIKIGKVLVFILTIKDNGWNYIM